MSATTATVQPASQPPATQLPAAQPAPQPTIPGGETLDQALTRAQAAAQAKRLNEAAGICNDVLAVAAELSRPPSPCSASSARCRTTPSVASACSTAPSSCAPATQAGTRISPRSAAPPTAWTRRCAAGQESVRLDPGNADNLVNLSLIFVDVDDRERAIACLLRALGQKHDHADGHLALAQNLLAMGDFAPGWLEYEWRNETEAGKNTMPKMTSAHWNGMAIPKGRILLVGDQGYGDTIQFARYIPMVAERCEEVVLGCSAEMGPILQNIPGVKQFCHRWNDVPGHAAHCRLSSLPYLFQTRIDSIPAQVPYLKADPGAYRAWRERLARSFRPAGASAWPGPAARRIRTTAAGPCRWRGCGRSREAAGGGAVFVSLQKPMPAARPAGDAGVSAA